MRSNHMIEYNSNFHILIVDHHPCFERILPLSNCTQAVLYALHNRLAGLELVDLV